MIRKKARKAKHRGLRPVSSAKPGSALQANPAADDVPGESAFVESPSEPAPSSRPEESDGAASANASSTGVTTLPAAAGARSVVSAFSSSASPAVDPSDPADASSSVPSAASDEPERVAERPVSAADALELEFAIDATTPPPPSDWLEYEDFFVTGQRLSSENLFREPAVEDLDEPPLVTASQLERRARFRRWVGRAVAVLALLCVAVFAKHALFPPAPLGEVVAELTPRAVEVSALTVRAATPDESAADEEPSENAASAPAESATRLELGSAEARETADPTSGHAAPNDSAEKASSDTTPTAAATPATPNGVPALVPRPRVDRVVPKSKAPKRKSAPKPVSAPRARALRSSPNLRATQASTPAAGPSPAPASPAPSAPPAQAGFPATP